jgi:hypothetical protein
MHNVLEVESRVYLLLNKEDVFLMSKRCLFDVFYLIKYKKRSEQRFVMNEHFNKTFYLTKIDLFKAAKVKE